MNLSENTECHRFIPLQQPVKLTDASEDDCEDIIEDGYSDGYQDGYRDGFRKGFEDGQFEAMEDDDEE
jgi:flagellar biosynthesis/type III secretory pathway protein FliH